MATQETSTEWSRRRLLAMLAGVVAFALLVIGGLAYAVVAAFSPDHATASNGSPDTHWTAGPDGVRGDAYRDALAAKPMLEANEDDMKPVAPALDTPRRMLIGPSTKTGPVDVPSGFAHTPEGAVAQLAAIEIAALTPMSVQYARDVHNAWAMDGAEFDTWEIAQSIQSFHASAGTVDGDGAVSVTTTPVGAQIKGTDGPDWVLACVQLDVTATVVEQTRFGFGHCERMQWTGDRWRIAAGKPPAQAPSTWPGSQRSLDAGWRLWVEEDDHDE
ncbi:hypothetical protein [Aeromicrobium ginsengisoli]|uniref:Uncharacterized protein n=1 Tax=Aeromicrobium ginsengisoli TaxID=363867 RepID=A0A5M4FER9_9ACTN|nr:hypothetical protein [Aeromicrobium ginsengisoli]KAA1397772.1 hypothetical protein ESP70_010520 [Aeromicrobium ginsengisoli]